jgi:hypothetical protein
MFNLDKIKKAIEDLNNDGMRALWNDYCEANDYYDDFIEYNDIDELLCGFKPSEVLSRVDTNNYSDYDDYCAWDGYGHLYSFDYVDDSDSPFDLDVLADWIYNNEDALGYLDEDEISDHFDCDNFVNNEMDENDIEQFLISNDISFNEDDDEITKAYLVKEYLNDLEDNVNELAKSLEDLGWLYNEERVLGYFN